MANVEINAGGRYVKVEQDGRDAETLLPLAQKAWQETEKAGPSEGVPAFGFRDERRGSRTYDAMSPGGYGNGYVEPVKAKGEVSNAHHV